MWRPENWENPCYKAVKKMEDAHEVLGVHYLQVNGASFEAGADAFRRAVLDELKKCSVMYANRYLWNPQMVRELIEKLEEE